MHGKEGINMADVLLTRNNSRIIEVVINNHVKYEGRVLEDGFMMSSLNAFEELLKLLQAEGYEIKRGKYTAVCGKEQKRFIRFRSLGEDFTEENLKKVIAGEKEPPERSEKVPDRKEAKPEKRKFDLVVDIQEKMVQGKNDGYVQWAKK